MENRLTVLVVEDDHDLRSLIVELLDQEGYTVAGARNGCDAMTSILDGLRPDLILLDLCLPVMSGPELLEWVRAQPALGAVPVLVVSCKDDRSAPLQQEVQGWIRKPSSPSELLTEVARLCDRDVRSHRRHGSGSWSAFRAAM